MAHSALSSSSLLLSACLRARSRASRLHVSMCCRRSRTHRSHRLRPVPWEKCASRGRSARVVWSARRSARRQAQTASPASVPVPVLVGGGGGAHGGEVGLAAHGRGGGGRGLRPHRRVLPAAHGRHRGAGDGAAPVPPVAVRGPHPPAFSSTRSGGSGRCSGRARSGRRRWRRDRWSSRRRSMAPHPGRQALRRSRAVVDG